MILKKEFYFLRHGETDHNRSDQKTDHGDIPLNANGRSQAERVAPLISQLPLQTVCCSPLQRAKETKELLALSHSLHVEIEDLGECTALIWHEMRSLGARALVDGSERLKGFLEQAKRGVNKALEQSGPVLIVAHGGIHWAICCWMGMEGHEWLIGNCEPVHFSLSVTGDWRARRL